MRRITILFLAWMLTASCRNPDPGDDRGGSVLDVYGNRPHPSVLLQDSPSPLRRNRIIPVLSPPEAFAVYVPTHLERDRDLLIGEHWVFFKVRDAEWFSEKQPQPAPEGTGAATREDYRRLKRIGSEQWEKIMVPTK